MSIVKKLVGACLLLALAGCGFGLQWPNLPAPGADPHNLLLVGDALMGSVEPQLAAVLTEATIFDEHRNGSGLVTPIDGMSPADFVNAMLDAHPTTDTVLAGWSGACVAPCPIPYGSQAFYDAWNQARQDIVDAVAARVDPPKVVWVISPPAPPDFAGAPYSFTEGVSNALSWQTRGWAASESVTLADWWAPLIATDGFLGHYDQFLAYQVWPEAFATPHQVRDGNLFLLTTDGAFRTAIWTATTLREVWAPA